jgi:hypothetical protein
MAKKDVKRKLGAHYIFCNAHQSSKNTYFAWVSHERDGDFNAGNDALRFAVDQLDAL